MMSQNIMLKKIVNKRENARRSNKRAFSKGGHKRITLLIFVRRPNNRNNPLCS